MGKEEVAATTDGVEEETWKVNQEKENSPTTVVTSSDNEDEDKDVSRVYQVVNKRTFVCIYKSIYNFIRFAISRLWSV